MRDIFRFWGFAPDVFHAVVGDDRRIRAAASTNTIGVLGHVDLDPGLADRCGPLSDLCASGWWSWLVFDPEAAIAGRPVATLRTLDGRRHTIVAQTGDGAWNFGLDVDATIAFIQNERYLVHSPPFYLKLGINPTHIPGRFRKWSYTALQWLRAAHRPAGPLFPACPVDPSVDGWRYLIRTLVQEQVSARSAPFWPHGKRYAVASSHDVDTGYCLRRPKTLDRIHEIESDVGMRSAWMVVARLLRAGRSALDDLHTNGHEIGFHGTHHDHKLAFLPPAAMAKRVARAAEFVEAYGTTGFRSPNYLRSQALYQMLDGVLEYDMSMHDVTDHSSQVHITHEGCSTCLPFLIEGTNVLQIPTTVQDDQASELAGLSPEQTWISQVAAVERIKARGGVANIVTHPEPHHSIRPPWLEAYRNLLACVTADEDAWVALPGEINGHWRSRQAAIDALWSREDAAHSRVIATASADASLLGVDSAGRSRRERSDVVPSPVPLH